MNLKLLRLKQLFSEFVSNSDSDEFDSNVLRNVSQEAMFRALEFLSDVTDGYQLFRDPSSFNHVRQVIFDSATQSDFISSGPDGLLAYIHLYSFALAYSESEFLREVMQIMIEDQHLD